MFGDGGVLTIADAGAPGLGLAVREEMLVDGVAPGRAGFVLS